MKKPVHEKFMFIMRVSLLQILFIVAIFSLAHASDVSGQEILNRKISIRIKRGNIREILAQIEKQTEVKFLFYSQLLPENEEITIHASRERLGAVLDKILLPRKIKYEADGNQIILTKKLATDVSQIPMDEALDNATTSLVKGQILDRDKQPIPGVNILVKGTTDGTSSDAEGRYSITVPDGGTVLIFSFIGFISQEISVGNNTIIDVTLAEDISTLNEVLVVGYGTQKKQDIISSISTVEGKDLNLRATPNFESGLQGMAAGVSVQSQSGAPGAPVRILIRGTSSINLSTDPLYIIDGMPISMGTAGLGNSNQSPMSLINQNDIENIQILKDAAATSIYGSRGSNGVIIITTKSGKKGEGNVQLNYSTGVSQLTRTPEEVGFANSKEWFQIMDKAYQNSGGTFSMNEYYDKVPLTKIALASPKLTREQAEAIDTDWYDELFDRGTFQNINLSASQGTENTAFYLSSNYRKDNGVQANNSLERFTIRTNLDFNPTKNLTISSKLTFGYTKNNQRESGITSIAVDALPWFPVYELDNPNRYFNAYTRSNPVAVRDPKNLLNEVQQYRGLGGVNISYRIPGIKGLSLKAELSGDIMQSNRVYWQGRDIRFNGDVGTPKPQSAATEEAVTYNAINYNAYATYDRMFNQHSFNMVGGVEATRSYSYYRSSSGIGLNGNYQEIGIPGISTVRGQQQGERYLLGYFGRANYKFKERYLIGLSARQDGSSVFTEENRWGTFVAFSAGWILSEENFMAFLNDKTFLKLRGSYGETGNQTIPENLDALQYNPNPITYGGTSIGGVNGTIPVNIAVTNLQWETTKSSDIGLDFGLFNNRLNGSVAYYHRYVDGMLLEAALPLSTGVSNPYDFYSQSSTIWGNFADMVNSGYELELHSVNYDNKGLKWTTDLNVGFNKNEIKSLTRDIDQAGRGLENSFSVSRKGDRRGVWYIADYAGIDPFSGTPLIYALDKEAFLTDGTTRRLKNNAGEDLVLPATISNVRANRFYQEGKSGDPKYQGGLTNTVAYKGFDFSFMFIFSGGNYILDYDRQQATIVNPTRTILKEVYNESWSETGDIAKYPQLTANFTHRYKNGDVSGFQGSESYTNRFLYKGDFIRLRNIQLGYTLPQGVIQRMKLKFARLYVSGSNLFTFTKYPGFDPEGTGSAQAPGFIYYSNAIPQLKSLTFGLDLKF